MHSNIKYWKNKILVYRYLIALFSILTTLKSYGQIKADFDATVKNGCGPLEVTFINKSTPATGLTYFWNLGNGNTSTVSNPFAIYINDGYYDITLIVSDGTFSDTIIKHNFIDVYNKPVPNFDISGKKNGCVPFDVAFINTSVNIDTSFSQWTWDFGDGTIVKERQPTHIYAVGGSFSVSVTVTDNNGCKGFITTANIINAVYEKANFYSTNTRTCDNQIVTPFSNTSNNVADQTYIWYFGDSTISTTINPIHTYKTQGAYSVSLVATHPYGCRDSITIIDYINVLNVKPSFNINRTIACKNEIFQLTSTSINATDYLWNFGDGDTTASTQQNPKHKYAKTGNYQITLQVSQNGECHLSATKLINIEYVKADFISPSYSCNLPAASIYTDNSINAVSWRWLFGSGDSSTLKNPIDSIFYLNAINSRKVFKDTLIVTSLHGCKDTCIRDSSYTIILPVVQIYPPSRADNLLKGCKPFTVNFQDQSTYASKIDYITQRSWNFADGHSSTLQNPSNLFADTGNYIVSLKITTKLGCTGSTSVSVHAGTPQYASFIINTPDTICAGQKVTFISQANNPKLIDSYIWNFGDGGSASTQPNAVHQYDSLGKRFPSLEILSKGCASFFTKAKPVYIKGPSVSIKSSFQCAKPYDYAFTGILQQAKNYWWDFGDTTDLVYNMQTVKHTYKYNGNPTIKIYATNDTNGCADTNHISIIVRNIKADFTSSKKIACVGDNISFDASTSNDQVSFYYNNKFEKYLWYFSDDRQIQFNNNPVNHVFAKRGNQQIRLIVEAENNCVDSAFTTVKIYQPQPDFKVDYQQGCLPAAFAFTDLSIPDTTITKWLWNFGDKQTDSTRNPVHNYLKFGNYNVSLILTDMLGCKDTLQKNGFIKALHPDPSFTVNDATLCAGDTAKFSIVSQSAIVNSYWDFGNGNTSALRAPQNIYADSGFYTVKLRIIDSHGCDTTGIKTNFINVQEYPVSDFTTDLVVTNCYPAQIIFYDKTQGKYVTDWKWNFGDNQTFSALQNPKHTYLMPGNFTVTLTTSTSNGCSNIMQKKALIYIKGPWAEIVANDTVCKNANTTLIASEKMNVYKLKWDAGNGISATTDTVYTIYNTLGNVYLTLLLYSDDNHTCDKVVTDSINVYKVVANFDVNNNSPDGCIPFKIQCLDQSTNAQYFTWYMNDKLKSTTTFYKDTMRSAGQNFVKLIIHNNFGCYDTLIKKITAFPLPKVSTSKDTLICRGDAIELFANGGVNYSWTPTIRLSNSQINHPIAQPDSSLKYFVTVVDTNKCSANSSVFITVQQIPKVVLRDTSVIIGEIVKVDITNKDIKSYSWFPDTAISCNNCPVITFKLLESTRYTVTVTDTMECFHKDYDIFIDIIKKYTVDVPEVFTPNGDRNNDVIYIRGWGIQELINFRIFNRFGVMVFESKDLSTGWDGTYKGITQGIETYTYIVQVKFYNGETVVKKGFIKLIR